MKLNIDKLRIERVVSKERDGKIISKTLTLTQNTPLKAKVTVSLSGKAAENFHSLEKTNLSNLKFAFIIDNDD